MKDYDTPTIPGRRNRRVFGLYRRDLGVLLVGMLILMGLMWLLNLWLFPDGTGLGDGDGAGPGGEWSAQSGRRDFSVLGAAGDDRDIVATLSRIQRTVKLRSADDIAWAGAATGAGLHDRDAVQTLARSRAVIEFGAGNTIELGERSLIVIQTSGADAFVPRRRQSLSLRSGEIDGRLARTGDAAAVTGREALEIELPLGRLRVMGGDAARFKIGVNPDDTSTVAIYSGSAELHAAGRAVRIGANQGVTFGAGDSELVVRALPAAPGVIGPADARTIRYGDMPPEVRFAWRRAAGVAQYRFVLARDPGLEDVVLEHRLAATQLHYDNLEDGRYYWQVSALRGWQQGPPSAPRSIALVRDLEAPSLSLESGVERTADDAYVVRGRTEPGARVVVDGQAVAPGRGGRFEHTLALAPGANLVVVEAIDEVGNIAFESQVIHRLARNPLGEVQ